MLRTARLTSGTRARSMRYACAMAPLMLWLLAHGMPPRRKTPIVCTLCVAMRYRSLYTRDLHHPPSCAVQYVATRRRSALHVHNSDGTRDGMPSRFLTADHCVSHHMLHSACVMRMCCGVGLSMWQVYLTTPPTSTAFLEYSIFYELRRHRQRHGSLLVLVSFIVHYVGRASYRVHPTSRPMAMAPKNRKLGSECVHRRIVPVRMCASVRSRWCVCMSDRRRIDVGRFLFIRAM